MKARVILAASASQVLLDIRSKADAKAVEKRLCALQTFPELGCPFDPEFPSAMPDHEVLVTFADHKGIYYTVFLDQDETPVVAIEWIRDVRMDPRAPFVSSDS